MDDNRFTELLQRYLEENISDAEEEELMQLILEGKNDEKIKGKIDVMLMNESTHEDISTGRAQEILKQILSTEKQTKVIPLQPQRTWRWVAAAAVAAIAVTAVWWTTRVNTASEQILTQQEDRLQPSVFSGKQFIHLPDGSTVLLNEGSELTYSESFGQQTREVTLTGEGYFDVQHDPSKPFKVLTGKVTTTVLGTAFNVKAYPDQKEIKVTVTRGKVKVGDTQRTYGLITPDQQIAVNTTTYDFVQSNIKAESATAWKSKYMILDDVSMEVAAAIIAEKYNVRVVFGNDDLKKCRITATFLNEENLDQVLTVVTGVVQANFTMQRDGNVKIDGKGC
jgi:transmembrane sensor